jgi:lipopolysaccharide transport system ATP-binding protein
MKDVATHGRTVLFVSHNMAAVKDLCTSAIFLAGGRISAAGQTDRIIRGYLDQGTGDEVRPERGALRRVRVLQEEAAIVVEADWAHSEPLRLPNLGFVIYDYMGAPVVGANPFLVGTDRADTIANSGRVTARLTEPRLLDGQYYLSVWFGDGARDFVELPKCISFEVRGMAGPRQHSASVVGPVAPRCHFSFDAPEQSN